MLPAWQKLLIRQAAIVAAVLAIGFAVWLSR
jgi:hypothetical protein